MQDGPASRPTINAPLLAVLVRRWAQPKPSSSTPPLGRKKPRICPRQSKGTIAGVLGAQAIPVRYVTPSWWKRRAGIPPGRDNKDMARSVAIARWPDRAEAFARVKDHDRAEACLIGPAFISDRERRA